MKQLKLTIRDSGKQSESVTTPWFDSRTIGEPKWYIVLTDEGKELIRIPAHIVKRG